MLELSPRFVKGKEVKVLRSSEGELVLRVGDKVVKVVPDFECVEDDCSSPDDPYVYLKFILANDEEDEYDDLGV